MCANHIGIHRPKENDSHPRQRQIVLGHKQDFYYRSTLNRYIHRDCCVCPFKLGVSHIFRTGERKGKEKKNPRLKCEALILSLAKAVYLEGSCIYSLSVWCRGLQHLYKTRRHMESFTALRCTLKSQCLLVSQQCQWLGVLAKVPYNGSGKLFSSDNASRIPDSQPPGCDQQNPLN